MKILKIILLVVFSFWAMVCIAKVSTLIFDPPFSYLVSILSGGMIGHYFALILMKYLSE